MQSNPRGREVMVVVVGNELSPVNQPKRNPEPRVACARPDIRFGECLKSENQPLTVLAKSLQKIRDGHIPVVRLFGPSVRRIRGSQDGRAGEEFVQTAHVELAQVVEVAEMLLDGP